MNKVIVKIAGVEYPIAGDETKEYLEGLGTLVNTEVENVTKNSSGVNLTMATTLAAINIADKLLKNGNNNVAISNDSDVIKVLEFKLQEKDVQIEALMSKLDTAVGTNENTNNDSKVQEIMSISNEFQNRIFELQQEVELLKNQLEKVDV